MELATETAALNAEGNVSSTFYSKPSAGGSPDEPIQVVADRLRYFRAEDRAEYTGHARLWQGEDFLLEANQIELLQRENEMRAQGQIYTVFGEVPMPPGAVAGTGAVHSTASYYVVRADSLRYREGDGRAHYSGNVRLEDAAARIMTAGELDLLFESSGRGTPTRPAQSAGLLREAVASDDVRITEGSRTATGDRAEYLPAQGQIVLYGDLATVNDPSQGITRGAKLTYLLGGDSIRVEGKPGSQTETRWRVPP
jgi:lipopolysaccharide export system protein LptA